MSAGWSPEHSTQRNPQCRCSFKPLLRVACPAGTRGSHAVLLNGFALDTVPAQGNCVTILGQRFPLGDIRQYFKYPVCVPRPGSPPPQDKLRRGELMSCWLGMPRSSQGDKG